MFIPKQKDLPKRTVFFGTIAVIVIFSIISSLYVYTEVDKKERQHILDRVNTISQAIPTDDLEKLMGTPEDIDTPEYFRTKKLLERIRNVNTDVRFIYLAGKNLDGSIFFYVDSEDPSSPDNSPPGQIYAEASPGIVNFFDTGASITEGPNGDRWGRWISGYAPVKNRDGDVVAFVGIDLPANVYLVQGAIYAVIPMLIGAILIILLAAAEGIRRKDQYIIEQKGEFLSIASHEIRAPLTGIRWGVDLILEGEKIAKDSDERKILELVQENSTVLIARVNNLLSLNALDSRGKEGLSKEDIPIPKFITGIARSLSLSARVRSVTFTIDDSVMQAGSIFADAQIAHHAFFNLVANAVKYTREHTEVVLTYAQTSTDHIFKIIDHGPGIAAEDQEKIFQGYHRTKQARSTGQLGTGLGLFLSRKAILMHGGTLSLTSVLGEGTTFIVTLPKTLEGSV